MKEKVVGSMSEWSGILKDLFRQIDDGSITKEYLRDFLEHCFKPSRAEALPRIEKLKEEWRKFYKEVFNMGVDFSSVRIPKEREDFYWLLIMAKGLTFEQIKTKYEKLFRVKVDIFLEHSDRTAKDASYAIWLRNRPTADEELSDMNPEDLKRAGIQGITLEERLLLEIFYWLKTKRNLDTSMTYWHAGATLCLGSRGYASYGMGIPVVSYCHGEPRGVKLLRESLSKNNSNYCAREVVS